MVYPVGGFSDGDDDDDDDDDEEEEAEAMEVEVIADHHHQQQHHHQQHPGGAVAEQDEASTDAEDEQVVEAVAAPAADDDDDDDDDDEDLVMASVVDDDDDADEVSSEAEVPSPPQPPAVAAAITVAAAKVFAVAAAAAPVRKTPGPKRKRKTPASATKTPTSTSSGSAAAASSSTKKKAKPRKKAPPTSSNNAGGSNKKGSSTTTPNKSSGGGGKQAAKTVTAAVRIPSYAKAYAKLPPVPPERLQVASGALKMLQEQVPVLPMTVGEVHVRSFGRLALPTAAALAKGGVGGAGAGNSTSASTVAAAAGGGGGGAVFESSAQQQQQLQQQQQQPAPFATRTALYPVGYSCDRHEYSPAHGRILKTRCSILDGRKIRQALQARGSVDAVKDDVKAFVQDGPVFRVTWGRGVDEEVVDDNVLYPFNPKMHAAPVDPSGKINESSSYDASSSATSPPTAGLRVKVRFDKNEYHYGTIAQATAVTAKTSSSNKKSRKQEYSITILYDDESSEVATYPDPDILLAMPGTISQAFLCLLDFRLFLCYTPYISFIIASHYQ
jgi:hypothetical protein